MERPQSLRDLLAASPRPWRNGADPSHAALIAGAVNALGPLLDLADAVKALRTAKTPAGFLAAQLAVEAALDVVKKL